MTEADAFLADIIAHPADDTPRLIFADWLEDHGDGARAEFIRVQVELWQLRKGPAGPVPEDSLWLANHARYQALRRRERELLRWGAAQLPRQVRKGTQHTTFRRGFVAAVTLPLAAWLAHGPALVRAAPLETVRLTDRPAVSQGAALPDSPPFSVYQSAPWPLARIGWHRTKVAALDALSAACLAWARSQTRAHVP